MSDVCNFLPEFSCRKPRSTNNLTRNGAPGILHRLRGWAILGPMKKLILGLILTCFAGSTFALDKQELDNRIRTLTARLDALQQKPGKRIPAHHHTPPASTVAIPVACNTAPTLMPRSRAAPAA